MKMKYITAAVFAAIFTGARRATVANAAGTHAGPVTRTVETVLPLRFSVLTSGTVKGDDVGPCGATDEPLGVSSYAATGGYAVGDKVAMLPLGAAGGRTLTAIASKAVAADARAYTTAAGKLTDTAVNDSWLVGRFLTAATADGDEVELEPCFPVQQTV